MAFFSWDCFKDLIYETMEYIFRENGREPFFVLCFCYLIEISVCCLKMVALDHWILYLFFICYSKIEKKKFLHFLLNLYDWALYCIGEKGSKFGIHLFLLDGTWKCRRMIDFCSWNCLFFPNRWFFFWFLAAADVFLWRNTKISAGVLGGATTVWVLFELLGYHLITLVCYLSIFFLAVLFLWSNTSNFLNK